MTDSVDRAWIEELLRRNRYLVLATTDGTRPWAAPLEYLLDDELNLYFLSPDNVRHARHIESNSAVAVAVFDSEQPEYTGQASLTIHGVQIEATADKLTESDFPGPVASAIEAWKPPMPPYAVFRVRPIRFFIPRIENGVNIRVEVDI